MRRPRYAQAHDALAHYARPDPKDPTLQSDTHYYVVKENRMSLDTTTKRVYSSTPSVLIAASEASNNGETASGSGQLKSLPLKGQ